MAEAQKKPTDPSAEEKNKWASRLPKIGAMVIFWKGDQNRTGSNVKPVPYPALVIKNKSPSGSSFKPADMPLMLKIFTDQGDNTRPNVMFNSADKKEGRWSYDESASADFKD